MLHYKMDRSHLIWSAKIDSVNCHFCNGYSEMDKFASFANVLFFHQNSLPQFCMTDAELIENMSQKKQNTEVIIIKISYFAAILKHSSLHMDIL